MGTYAENAKIFLCGNKFDQKSRIQITDSDMEAVCEQCHNLVSGVYKTSCRTGEGVHEMFQDIAAQLATTNRSRMELQTIEERSFQASVDQEKNSIHKLKNLLTRTKKIISVCHEEPETFLNFQ